MSEKKISREQEAAMEGSFDTAYTTDWFLKVKPAYGTGDTGIDHIGFSFVKKGSNGQDSFDIYVGIRKFRAWALRIQKGTFFQDLEKERERGEKFPCIYRIKAGEKGVKTLGFMLSDNPGYVVISAKDAAHNYVNIPLEYGFLENLAEDFLNTSRPRFEELEKMTMDTANSYRQTLSGEEQESMQETPGSNVRPSQPLQACPPSERASVSADKVEVESFWEVARGSVREQRGKDGKATVLRLIVGALGAKEPGILPDMPGYQLVDCVFYERAIEKANLKDIWTQWMSSIDSSTPKMKLGKLRFKMGDIRDGYRQLIFQI